MRYLRNKVDGTIYEWHPALADNPKCVEVTEEEAFPARKIEKALAETPLKKGRPKKVELEVVELEEAVRAEETPVNFTSEDFGIEASKGWPK
jgi:hypothetical protein